MDEKERIETLTTIKNVLLKDYGDDYYFRHDLRDVLWAINARIAMIKKGEV